MLHCLSWKGCGEGCEGYLTGEVGERGDCEVMCLLTAFATVMDGADVERLYRDGVPLVSEHL